MKIVCGVCLKEEASVFCCADEAALCDACDQRVHRANKVAGKHRRFSLSAPSAQSDPLCDICQEKRGFLFCQDDRAILCKDCDASVHGANRLTMKHNRFLLAGVRLSAVPISSPPSTGPETKTAVSVSQENKTSVADASTSCSTTGISDASSISEYLTKTCPGWCVEDLLVDEAAAAMVDFTTGNGLLPFPEPDGGGLYPAADKLPAWALQVPQFSPPCLPASASVAGTGHYQPCQGSKVTALEQWREQAFTVPQISPASAPTKRPRHSLWFY
ncbi:B-box zinc finger protein 20-like [Curcuma longa]|uniref:B-box zinc finger protein 20-like n=1 Tax=Curcuma longa TaxID=136217 RepID=UPI003D9EC4BB